jgi:glycosyltransferase involved in cell wall biosynthesis
LTNIYGSCRVFAQPSQFENFSFAALEAMAAGRAVVITSTAGLAGFVEAHRLGEVIPPGDPVALARALSRFVADPSYAGEVGERARAVVRRELDPDRMAALREQVYCGAIESFRRRR